MRLLPIPLLEADPPATVSSAHSSSGAAGPTVEQDQLGALSKKPFKSALKNPLLPTVSTNAPLEQRLQRYREIREDFAKLQGPSSGKKIVPRPLGARAQALRKGGPRPVKRVQEDFDGDEDLESIPSQAAVRRFLDEKYSANLISKNWFTFSLPDVTEANIRNSYETSSEVLLESQLTTSVGSKLSKNQSYSTESILSVPARRASTALGRIRNTVDTNLYVGKLDFLGRRTRFAEGSTADKFASESFAEQLDDSIEQRKQELQRREAERMERKARALKEKEEIASPQTPTKTQADTEEAQTQSTSEQAISGLEWATAAAAASAEASAPAPVLERRPSSPIVKGEDGKKTRTVEVASRSAVPGRRQRRVSITITEHVIDPEDEEPPAQDGEPEAAAAARRKGRRRSRRMSVISVNELEVLDQVLVQEVDDAEDKVPKAVGHYLRIKSILMSAEIVCPTTMRAHLVRYNREPALQTFALIGLEHALSKLEGGREVFFGQVLPVIISRATMVTQLFRTGIFPSLRNGVYGKLALSRVQVACMLANLFLCALPNQDFSFSGLLCSQQSYQVSKLLFFINYFRRLADLPLDQPKGTLWFVRNVLDGQVDWGRKPITMLPLRIHEEGSIEEAHGALQVDFSHRQVGGGLLFRGSNEEESRFCMCPEMSVAMIVCNNLADNEALLIKGAERFSKAKGMGFSLAFDGDFRDDAPREPDGSMATTVVAIDPLRFDRRNRTSVRPQLTKEALQRELDKAYIGFLDTPDQEGAHLTSVATGLWGCGVSRGAPEIKSLIQWMAATTAGKEMDLYCEDRRFRQRLEAFRQRCMEEEATVEMLWSALVDLGDFDVQDFMVFDGLSEILFGKGDVELPVEGADAPAPRKDSPPLRVASNSKEKVRMF